MCVSFQGVSDRHVRNSLALCLFCCRTMVRWWMHSYVHAAPSLFVNRASRSVLQDGIFQCLLLASSSKESGFHAQLHWFFHSNRTHWIYSHQTLCYIQIYLSIVLRSHKKNVHPLSGNIYDGQQSCSAWCVATADIAHLSCVGFFFYTGQRWLMDQKSECPHCRAPLLVSQLVSCRFISEISLVKASSSFFSILYFLLKC